MAIFKDKKYLVQKADDYFDEIFEPGEEAPFAGIYRCIVCGREVTARANEPLPADDHHEHQPNQGAIHWRLIARTDQSAGQPAASASARRTQ